MPDAKIRNPIPGDELFSVCVQRQVGRNVPEKVANDICITLSAALGANALKEASDMVLVPAVLTAEGVHNGLFKPWESIANAAPTLVGVPFFINQPGEHENGVTPPVDDPSTHHGLVLTVNKDEKKRRITGIIGLFKPDFLKSKGFSSARIKFQQTLIDSLQKGARHAVSVTYLTSLAKRPGMHANKAYAFVETKHVFNGVSIVPQGAEPTALMNGANENIGFDFIENGFNADFDDANLANDAETIEPLNNPDEQSGSKAMDADEIRRMSITHLSGMNPEVGKLANAHEKLQGDFAAANKHSTDLESQVKALQKDAEKTASVLANILDEDKAEQILANVENNVELAEKVQEVSEKLANELSELRAKDEEKLKESIANSKKALANRMKAEDLKPFEDPKDLAGTAARLERLANAVGAKRVVAPVTPLANVDMESLDDDETEEDEMPIANAEYDQMLSIYSPGESAPAAKAGKTRGGA